MPAERGPTVRRRRLAAELRRLRERAEMTLEQSAGQVEWSVAKLSRVETARVACAREPDWLKLSLQSGARRT